MTRNHQLEAARQSVPSPRVPGACLSRDELAEAVNDWLHRNVGQSGALDGQYVGRLERGAVRRPGRDYRAGFRAVLGIEEDAELGFVTASSSHAPLRVSQSPAPEAAGDPLATPLAPDDQARLTHVSRCARRVDRPALDSLAEVLASVRRLEDETSAADVLPSVLAQRSLIDRLATEAPQQLHSTAVGLASEIEQYLGWLAIPGRRWEDSRHHLDRAAVLALQADDPQRLATALSFQAYRSMRCDELPTADALSQAAGRDTRIETGLRTYLVFQRAEILARSGDKQNAVKLLSDADHMIDHLPPVDELPSSGYWYTPAFFLGQKAFALDALGDSDAARDSAAACLAEMPPEWATSEWATRRRALAQA